MRAVILAAGRGRRMGASTRDRPKCLIDIGGRSLLDRQLAAFRSAGVDDVGVVTGWRADRFADLPVTTFHNPAWSSTSMVDSLARARPWLRTESVLVCYGDILVAPGDISLVSRSPASITIAYDPNWLAQWRRRFVEPLDDAETLRLDPAGRVTDIGGRPHRLSDVEGQYIGLLKLDPVGWARIEAAVPTTGRRDMTAVLARLVATDVGAVHGVAIEGPWHEFDLEHDLAAGRGTVDRLDELLVPRDG